MPDFTVIGLYLDQRPPQRFAETYDTFDARAAWNLAMRDYDPMGCNDLMIAAVIEGKHVPVDE